MSFYVIRQRKNSTMPIKRVEQKKSSRRRKNNERDLHANRPTFPQPNIIDPPNLCKKLFFDKKIMTSRSHIMNERIS